MGRAVVQSWTAAAYRPPTRAVCCHKHRHQLRCLPLLKLTSHDAWLLPLSSLFLPRWQEQTISDKFASLSEALQVAESKARESTEMRKQVALEMARRQKMAKDEQLRKLALQARMERGGTVAAGEGAERGGGGRRRR